MSRSLALATVSVVCLAFCAPLAAQVQHADSVEMFESVVSDQIGDIQQTQYSQDGTTTWWDRVENSSSSAWQSTNAVRDWWGKAYQGVDGGFAYIGDVNNLSLVEFNAGASIATYPVLSGPPPLFQPRFTSHSFDVDDGGLGLPKDFYTTSFGVNWFYPYNDRWTVNIAVAPMIASDFETKSAKAWRVSARALGFYKWSDTLNLAVGVVFTGRKDIPVLPGIGLTWNPDPNTKVDLMIPRPKFAKRMFESSSHNHWAYIGGELGGGSWAFDWSDGTTDILNYRDLRLLFGWEMISQEPKPGKARKPWLRFETGYVFARKISFQDASESLHPDGTYLLRAELSY